MRPATLSLIGLLVALTATAGMLDTGAAFSDPTQNPGNSFSAATSFCSNPGTQTVIADSDAYVDQQQPGTNYGTGLTLEVQSRINRNRRLLVHFSMPGGQYCSVTSATLRLNATTVALGRTLHAYQLASPWTETGVTWSNQPLTAGSPSSAPSALGWIQFDVTSQIQAMYAGSNDGFLVRDSSESQNPASLEIFTSREALVLQPELLITLA